MSSGSRLDSVKCRKYLDAMGIQTWTPRIELPGAKPSLSSESTRDVVEPAAALVSQATRQDATAAAGKPVEGQGVEKNGLSPTNDGSKEDNEALDRPRFRLVSLLYPGHCMVVSDFPVDKERYISSEQHRLLSDMLLTLGVRDSESATPVFFEWPMQNQQLDQGRDGALDAVKAFLSAQIASQKLRFVLIMGDTASRYLLPHEAELASPQGKLWSLSDYAALITDSIDTMLEQPLRKREVWRHLQSLCRLITNSI